MNVGISSSFNSEGGGGADRRAGCSAGLTYPAGGTGVGRMPRSRNGSTPGAAREAVSAPAAGLSNPVAITVTRISPCMAGSFTVPKMISASSPAASFTTSEIWVTSPAAKDRKSTRLNSSHTVISYAVFCLKKKKKKKKNHKQKKKKDNYRNKEEHVILHMQYE